MDEKSLTLKIVGAFVGVVLLVMVFGGWGFVLAGVMILVMMKTGKKSISTDKSNTVIGANNGKPNQPNPDAREHVHGLPEQSLGEGTRPR